ncbi:MAG: FAD binding domain-containing protein [Armatimonadetes bacterium]|nr:FAD binding domain-containing protein [Armatimonadota bacterium]MDE2205628.1 FAD binding domain-containing protein [Armatimonadota bacterium]
MKAFELHNPAALKEAIQLLDATDTLGHRVKLMAGGQDLLTEMKSHLAEPATVVNLKHLPGMNHITWSDRDGLLIGALATIDALTVHPLVQRHAPALAMAAAVVGSPQIRHIGTLGGNLCQRPRCWYYRNENIICLKKGGDRCYAAVGENKYHAILGGGPSYIVHPSDTAPALIALNARVTLVSAKGARTIPLQSFYALPTVDVRKETVLRPDEILTEIHIPNAPMNAHSAYIKFREKESMDFAMSAAAAALEMNNGVVAECRLALGGVAPVPWRAEAAEAALRGKRLTTAAIDIATAAALKDAQPLEHNGYKVPLTRTILKRAIRQAAA